MGQKKVWRRKTYGKTYALDIKGTPKENNKVETRSMEILVQETEKDLMQKSYIGRLLDTTSMENLRECFMLNGLKFLRLRCMRDNVVLITSEGGENIEKIVEEHREWLITVFELISPWPNH